MPPRAPKKQIHGRDFHASQPANHCRALVRVDGTALRKKTRKDYEQALRDLEKSQRVLDRFQHADLPQFTRWFNSHFGALLTELRELDAKLAADDALVFLVQNEVFFGGKSYARAYKRVMELRDNPEPPPPPPHGHRGQSDGRPDSFDADPERQNPDGGEDPLKKLFEEMFGTLGPDEDPQTRRDFRTGPAAGPVPPEQNAMRLKELYRAVVRRLHPDSQREMTRQKTEWWHQAQSAYVAGDVQQLEVILTLCEIGESGTTTHTSISLLQRITARLKNSLREIKRQISQRRRDPAWNFSERTDHAAMIERMRGELTADLMELRRRWTDTQSMIAKWKTAAEKLKPSRPRKSPPSNPEFLF